MEFVALFTEMSWIVVLLLTLGLIFLIIEAAIPGFGFFGATGILCAIAAIIVQGVLSKSFLQVFYLIILILVVIAIVWFIFVHSIRKGVLKRSPIVEEKTALPVDYNDETKNPLNKYVGQEGEVVSECNLLGKIKIDEEVVEAMSERGSINVGEKIRVNKVKGTILYVEKIKEEEK